MSARAKWGDQDSATTIRSGGTSYKESDPSPQVMDTSSYDEQFPSLSGFSETNIKDYRDKNDFDDDEMTDVSDNPNDNRTVCSAASNVTWAATISTQLNNQQSASLLPANASPTGQAALLTQLPNPNPSSLQRASRNPGALRGTSQKSSSSIAEFPYTRPVVSQQPADNRKPPPPEPPDTKFENLRRGYMAQMHALEQRHSAEHAMMLQTLASIQAQLHAVQQHNTELSSRTQSISSSSLSTSTEIQPYTTPTRKSIKSKTMQQRSPPVDPSATSEATKRSKIATANQYESLAPIDDDEEDVYFFDEKICTADMSIDDTVTRVEGLHIQQQHPPASGSNGAGIKK